ncbi:hypothetical protein G9A89_004138 [Geosiphon pyriformis]|nr:hypothetical protein G9A89_004138 [Geosiphon pyriformis]
MAPTKLKFKGNKAFSMLSTIESEADLSKTWRLMTKVKDALEYGKRLENLSWRLWFMHHQMVHDHKTQSKFKKLSISTTRKLETEKATELSKLAAPTYRPRGLESPDKKGKKKSNNKKQSLITTTKKGGNNQKNASKNNMLLTNSVALSPTSASSNHDKKLNPLNVEYNNNDEDDDDNNNNNNNNNNNLQDEAPITSESTTNSNNNHQDIILDTTSINGDLITSVNIDDDDINDATFSVRDAISVPEGNDMTLDGNVSPLNSPTLSIDEENNELTAAVLSQLAANDDSNLATNNAMQELFNEMNGISHQEFVLHQYTNDQDPYQVVRLPGPFVGFDAAAFLHPDRAPVMELDIAAMFRMREFYPSSPDTSEPTSPTEMDWFNNNNSMLSTDAVNQQSSAGIQSNLSYQLNSQINDQLVAASASGIHNAVYVPRSSSANSNLNNSLILNPTLNGSNVNDLSGNTLIGSMSGNNIVYVGHQYSTDPSSVNATCSTNLPQPGNNLSSTTSSTSSTSSHRQSSITPEGRPKKSHSNGEQQCFNCGVTSTPLWRRSANDELLCNACGLYLKLHKMARPKTMKPHIVRKDARDDETAQPVCSNCGTMTTPLWRRDEEGQTLCNACGLYFKLHHEKRPLSMKTDVIKKRQRYENGQNPSRRSSKKQRSIDEGAPDSQQPQPIQTHQQQQQQQQQQVYGPISVSPTTSTNSMTIPTGNTSPISAHSTPSLNMPASLGPISLVDQEINSPIALGPTSSSMTAPAPNRSLHGSFLE